MCARCFFFKYQSLLQKITPEIRLSKPYSKNSLFFNVDEIPDRVFSLLISI